MAVIFATVALRLYGQLRGDNAAAMEQLKTAHAAEIIRIDAAHKAAIERSDAAYQSERTRADRMEAELREFNKLVNDKLAGELVRAADVVRETLEMRNAERRRA